MLHCSLLLRLLLSGCCPLSAPHTYRVQATPGPSYAQALKRVITQAQDTLQPQLLLLNAIQMEDPAGNAVNARLVEMLLARNVPLEEVWPDSGETPLLMAAALDDAAVRRHAVIQLLLLFAPSR